MSLQLSFFLFLIFAVNFIFRKQNYSALGGIIGFSHAHVWHRTAWVAAKNLFQNMVVCSEVTHACHLRVDMKRRKRYVYMFICDLARGQFLPKLKAEICGCKRPFVLRLWFSDGSYILWWLPFENISAPPFCILLIFHLLATSHSQVFFTESLYEYSGKFVTIAHIVQILLLHLKLRWICSMFRNGPGLVSARRAQF